MKKMLMLTLSAALGISSIALIGCEKSDTEKAQDAQKDAMKDSSKAMKDAAGDMKDAAKDVGKAGKDATSEAQGAAEKATAAAQNVLGKLHLAFDRFIEHRHDLARETLVKQLRLLVTHLADDGICELHMGRFVAKHPVGSAGQSVQKSLRS